MLKARDWEKWTWYSTWNHLVPDYQVTAWSQKPETETGEKKT